MKKVVFAVASAMLLLFSLTSCGGIHNEEHSLGICGSYGVPGLFLFEMKGDEYDIQVLERDSFGRILFLFEADSIISETKEKVFVICQKYDYNYVYFLEDYCYCDALAESSVIEQWKQDNSWDQPLDIRMMSRRPNRMTLDKFINIDSLLDYSEVRKAVYQSIGEKETKEIVYLDSDTIQNEMYCVKTLNGEVFLALVNLDYNVALLPLENQKIHPQTLANFKAENGWVYGF